jgi:hypothetical protein
MIASFNINTSMSRNYKSQGSYSKVLHLSCGKMIEKTERDANKYLAIHLKVCMECKVNMIVGGIILLPRSEKRDGILVKK